MRTLMSLVVLVAFLEPRSSRGVRAQSRDDYGVLVRLYRELGELARPRERDGMPDYTPPAVGAREHRLEEMREELASLDPEKWPVAEKVDYRLVRARLNALEFEHRVLRPWARDPLLYLDWIETLPYAELPLAADRIGEFRSRLRAVPRILQLAKANLTEGAGELVKVALRNLERSDGVEDRQPLLPLQPQGVRGWYAHLVESLGKHHPDLVGDGRRALAAVEDFEAWLKANQSSLSAPAGVGRENYDWYLKNVKLMPFDAEDCLRVGRRELQRSLAFLKFEQNKNRHLPPLEPAKSAAQYQRRIEEAERHVREFTRREGILTIPDWVGTLPTGVPWIARPGGKRNFWEEVQYRDPRPDHVHAVIPGHRFDGVLAQRHKHPIRGSYADPGRIEGWGFYLEEMYLEAGFLAELPRTRELFYIFQAARAVRNEAEVRLHTNEFTIEEATRYMVERVPFMDEDVARVDAVIYLRRPTYGIGYQMGKIQIEQLLAERAQQLGDKFNLKEFHDRFLSAGRIPVSLIRWEMTGHDQEVRESGPATSSGRS